MLAKSPFHLLSRPMGHRERLILFVEYLTHEICTQILLAIEHNYVVVYDRVRLRGRAGQVAG